MQPGCMYDEHPKKKNENVVIMTPKSSVYGLAFVYLSKDVHLELHKQPISCVFGLFIVQDVNCMVRIRNNTPQEPSRSLQVL